MQFWPDLFPAEQHHADETGLDDKCCQHFVGEQWADYGVGNLGEAAEIGAEL